MNINVKTKVVIALVVLLVCVGFGYVFFPNEFMTESQMLSKGEVYQKAGKTALALELYNRAVERFPNSYDARVHLGNALLEAEEPEKAREQFDYAISLKKGNEKNAAAQLALAKMLIAEKKYREAERSILSVGDNIPPDLQQVLGDLYAEWAAEKYDSGEKELALKKYKLSYKNYKEVDQAQAKKMEERIVSIYDDLSNTYLANDEIDRAIDILKDSIDFSQNPRASVKLAEIYKKQNKIDEAIEVYTEAYEYDTTGASALYLSEMLVEKGVQLADKNNFKEAKECFKKAQEVNPSTIIPAEILYAVDLSKIVAKFLSSKDSTTLSPEIAFKVVNKSDEPLGFLKAKVEFFNDGKLIGEDIKTLIFEDAPLDSKGSTDVVKFSYPSALDSLKKAYNIQAKIYLANEDASSWCIARTVNLTSKKKYKKSELTSSSTKVSKPTTVSTQAVSQPKLSTQPLNNSGTPAPQTMASEIIQRPTAPAPEAKIPVTNSAPSPQPILMPIDSSSKGNVKLPPIKSE